MSDDAPVHRRYDCRDGTFYVNVNDTYVGQSLARYGEWSRAETALFAQIVRAGDTVVEAGANIGSHTVALSRQVGEAGRVIAFEPARHSFQLLCANLVANDRLNVFARPEGLGARRAVVELPCHDPRTPFNFGATSFQGPATARMEAVTVLPLDELALDRLELIKADVEGLELDLLDGAMATIARLRPAISLEVNSVEARDGAVGRLAPRGYDCWYYITPMFEPDNWRGDLEDIFANYSFDLICLPRERFACAGLPPAEVGDDNFVIEGGQVRWRAHDWREARITRLGGGPDGEGGA